MSSTRKSAQDSLGENTYRLTTEGITDVMDHGAVGSEMFSLVGVCTDKNLRDVILDPPRSGAKKQAALAILTAVAGERQFMIEMVRLVSQDELASVTVMMRKLHALSKATRFNLSGEQPDWSTPESGLGGVRKRSRRLSPSPTDESMLDA